MCVFYVYAQPARSPLLATSLASLAAVHYGTGTAAIVNVHRLVIKSSLFTGKWVG